MLKNLGKPKVSTHSRPKAAGLPCGTKSFSGAVSTHSRPKAAGTRLNERKLLVLFQHTAARRRLAHSRIAAKYSELVSTHSRPKAAGHYLTNEKGDLIVSTHSRPKAAGKQGFFVVGDYLFQHTAARRRLGTIL